MQWRKRNGRFICTDYRLILLFALIFEFIKPNVTELQPYRQLKNTTDMIKELMQSCIGLQRLPAVTTKEEGTAY